MSWSLDLNTLHAWSLFLQKGLQGLQGNSVIPRTPPQLLDLAGLSMDVLPCLVITGTLLLGHLEADSMGWMSLAERETQYRQVWLDIAQCSDRLLPNLTCSPSSGVSVPDSGPVVHTAILWRPVFDSCGCFTVASYCRGGHCHLETASEHHSSPLQGR